MQDARLSDTNKLHLITTTINVKFILHTFFYITSRPTRGLVGQKAITRSIVFKLKHTFSTTPLIYLLLLLMPFLRFENVFISNDILFYKNLLNKVSSTILLQKLKILEVRNTSLKLLLFSMLKIFNVRQCRC